MDQLNGHLIVCRYYVAEGVRIYSQQSWKMIVGTEGKHMVEKYITETVSIPSIVIMINS